MKNLAVLLIITGVLLLGAGLITLFMEKFSWFGHLPGDFYYRGKSFTFRFPLVTFLLVSLVLTIIINLIIRFFVK